MFSSNFIFLVQQLGMKSYQIHSSFEQSPDNTATFGSHDNNAGFYNASVGNSVQKTDIKKKKTSQKTGATGSHYLAGSTILCHRSPVPRGWNSGDACAVRGAELSPSDDIVTGWSQSKQLSIQPLHWAPRSSTEQRTAAHWALKALSADGQLACKR